MTSNASTAATMLGATWQSLADVTARVLEQIRSARTHETDPVEEYWKHQTAPRNQAPATAEIVAGAFKQQPAAPSESYCRRASLLTGGGREY